MRYRESKEHSGELLRLALPLMARQVAGLHPVSYALWYEHVAGINPPLSKVLEERLESSRPLDEEEVYRLHARHIAARDVELLQGLHQRLNQLLEETAKTVEMAGTNSAQFGEDLSAKRVQLRSVASIESVRSVVDEMIRETARMQRAVLEASDKLEARAREVQWLTEQLERAQTEALQDPLTGLLNRRGFERTILEQDGTDLSGAALLVADLDHFKRINDVHGHLLGDRVLQAIARTFQQNVKSSGILARLGGEEFAILLPNTSLGDARALAESLRFAVSMCKIHGRDGRTFVGMVTISLGVAAASAGESLEQLIHRADAAMYQAKGAGRNRVLIAARSNMHEVASGGHGSPGSLRGPGGSGGPETPEASEASEASEAPEVAEIRAGDSAVAPTCASSQSNTRS